VSVAPDNTNRDLSFFSYRLIRLVARDTNPAPCGLFIYTNTPTLIPLTSVGMIPTATVGMACGLTDQSTDLLNSLPRSSTVSESRRIKPRTFGNTGSIDPHQSPRKQPCFAANNDLISALNRLPIDRYCFE
jgi:hypothetical protein